MAEIAVENENVVAVKQANNDELGPIEGLDILAGNDEIFLRTLEIGGTGGILVASHVVGDEMRALYDAAGAGDLDRARELHEKLAPVYEAMSRHVQPDSREDRARTDGRDSARVRLPMVEADDEQRAAVRAALEAHGTLANA